MQSRSVAKRTVNGRDVALLNVDIEALEVKLCSYGEVRRADWAGWKKYER
jgi:hypothetical protein